MPSSLQRRPLDVGEYLSDKDLEELSRWKLNGREIKNVVKTAYLWCSYNNFKLTRSRLEASISVTTPEKSNLSDSVEVRPRKRARRESPSSDEDDEEA